MEGLGRDWNEGHMFSKGDMNEKWRTIVQGGMEGYLIKIIIFFDESILMDQVSRREVLWSEEILYESVSPT